MNKLDNLTQSLKFTSATIEDALQTEEISELKNKIDKFQRIWNSCQNTRSNISQKNR